MFKFERSYVDTHFDSPEGVEATLLFVLATINTKTTMLEAKCRDIVEHGVESKYLTPHQAKHALPGIYAASTDIHLALQAGVTAAELITKVAEIPGFGITKAAFVVQILTGKGGCLDRHWLRQVGLNTSAFAGKATAKKIHRYLETCKLVGTSEFMWDHWCDYIAKLYPAHFTNGDHVSALHTQCISILAGRNYTLYDDPRLLPVQSNLI
jgi:hypothetical protein